MPGFAFVNRGYERFVDRPFHGTITLPQVVVAYIVVINVGARIRENTHFFERVSILWNEGCKIDEQA